MASRIAQSDIVKLLGMMRPQNPVHLKKVRVGSERAGWVLPDDFEGLSAVLSLGAGPDLGFDRFFAERGLQVYQYDPTVSEPAEVHRNFQFSRMAWAAENSEGALSLAQMLEDRALGSSFDMVLKFDVGNAEWGALDSCSPELLARFRIVTAELHSLCLLEEPANLDLFLRRMALLTARHTPVHLHADNGSVFRLIDGVPVPDVVRLTLLRNDRDRFVPSFDPIPGPLDSPRVSRLPDIVLRTV
jgi:hypothetical protein